LWLIDYAGGGVEGSYSVDGSVSLLIPTNSDSSQPTEQDIFNYVSRSGYGTLTQVGGLLTATGYGAVSGQSGWYLPQYVIFHGGNAGSYQMGSIGAITIYQNGIIASSNYATLSDSTWGGSQFYLNTSTYAGTLGSNMYDHQHSTVPAGVVSSHTHTFTPAGWVAEHAHAYDKAYAGTAVNVAVDGHTHAFTPAGSVAEHGHTYDKPYAGTAVYVAPEGHTHTFTPAGSVSSHTHTGPSHTHTITAV
jgi:hypothetical protein